MGIVARCIGHGKKVGIVQCVKGKWETGERVVLDAFPELVNIRAMGEGVTWETQDRSRDIKAAAAAWTRAKEMIQDPDNFYSYRRSKKLQEPDYGRCISTICLKT